MVPVKLRIPSFAFLVARPETDDHAKDEKAAADAARNTRAVARQSKAPRWWQSLSSLESASNIDL